jgi:hypothetical protein
LDPKIVRHALILFILLYSPVIQELPRPPAVSPELVPTVPKSARIQLKKNSRKFITNNYSDLDKESFLQSFRAQCPESLVDCLKNSKGEGPLIYSAILTKKGVLRNAYQLTANGIKPLPECAIDPFAKMTFEKQSKKLRSDRLEIQWQVEFN